MSRHVRMCGEPPGGASAIDHVHQIGHQHSLRSAAQRRPMVFQGHDPGTVSTQPDLQLSTWPSPRLSSAPRLVITEPTSQNRPCKCPTELANKSKSVKENESNPKSCSLPNGLKNLAARRRGSQHPLLGCGNTGLQWYVPFLSLHIRPERGTFHLDPRTQPRGDAVRV